jgi:transaldolase/glucose-6-phosphate isomerase
VDKLLPEGSPLRGKVAIANARRAYRRFQELFSGPRWQRLADARAMLQRPLWASTGTKNPVYSDVVYVEELIAPDTVNTLPEATLHAFLDHGRVRPAIVDAMPESRDVLRQATAAGLDLRAVSEELLQDGLDAFATDFAKLLDEIEAALARPASRRVPQSSEGVSARLEKLQRDDVVRRIWRRDHTVWKPDRMEITKPNRLGWLSSVEDMQEKVDELREFAEEVKADGLQKAVVLGMGGSSLAAEVLFSVFGAQKGGLQIEVLDTTVPDEIAGLRDRLDLSKTLFIVASKSGTTIEPLCLFAHFWELVTSGRHFVAITDPHTHLESLARVMGFRRTFLNPPSIGDATPPCRTLASFRPRSWAWTWRPCSMALTTCRWPATIARPRRRTPAPGWAPPSRTQPWPDATS